MKCTACGNENQPGAKFCVHCGVVLSLTAPASAIAPAATASLGSASTGQRPVLAPQSTPAAAQTAARPAAPLAPAVPPPAATAAPGQAAAQTSSRTLGLAVAGIALLIVLGAGGYIGYRMLAGEGSKQVTASAEPAKTETPIPAPVVEPARDATGTAQQTPPGGTAAPSVSSPASAGPAQAPAGAPPAAAPSSSPPLPGQPATAPDGTPTKTAVARAPKAVPAQPVQTAPAAAAGAPSAAAPTPAPSKAPPAKTVTAQVDRWQMYADEMAQCAKEDFFSRLGCQQRTRARYCEGYWGKVPQCPGAAPVDHGQ